MEGSEMKKYLYQEIKNDKKWNNSEINPVEVISDVIVY